MIRNRFTEGTYDHDLGCFLDQRFHCKGSSGGTSTTSVAPSKEQRAILGEQLNIQQDLKAGGELDFFPGQTLTDVDPLTTLGQTSAVGQIPGLQEFLAKQEMGLEGLLGGANLNIPGIDVLSRDAMAGLTSGELARLPEPDRAAIDILRGGGGADITGLPGPARTAISDLTRGSTADIPGLAGVSDEMARALSAPLTRQLEEQILPGISSAAVQQGAFGGDRADILRDRAKLSTSERIAEVLTRSSLQAQSQFANQALAQEQLRLGGVQSGVGLAIGAQGQEAGQALTQEQLRQASIRSGVDLSMGAEGRRLESILSGLGISIGTQGQLAGQEFTQEQLRQGALTSGLAAAPQLIDQALLPSQILGGVGGAREDRGQQEIEAARERFEFGEFAPTDFANRMSALLSGLNFGTVSTTRSSGGGK